MGKQMPARSDSFTSLTSEAGMTGEKNPALTTSAWFIDINSVRSRLVLGGAVHYLSRLGIR